MMRTPVITGAGQAFPPPMPQAALWEDHFRARSGSGAMAAVAEKIWSRSGIETRHGAADPRFDDVSSWGTGARMQRFVTDAMPLGHAAVVDALKTSGISAADVGLFAVVSCTGYATPGLDIRLATELGMTPEVQRLHIGHMGCYAALPGLGAVSDFVAARGRPAVLLCVELTSLHVQSGTGDDLQQVVAHALFSDAAAAVVVEPAAATGWEVIDTMAVTDSDTSALMTWDVTDLGFKMGLSPEVPVVLARHVGPAVERLLRANGLELSDVRSWAVHPGGRKIVEVVGRALGLTDTQLNPSYEVLRDNGNCSSATVLLVLDKLLAEPGDHAVAMAFGPGLTLYTTLLRRR